MSSLNDMSMTQLRGIAQSYGIADFLSKEKHHLIQEIELKQVASVPQPVVSIPKPEYDARLMTKPPARTSSVVEIKELLQPYVSRGMHLTFPEPEIWEMKHGDKTDTGTIRQPLRNILRCAEKLMANGIVRE